MPVLWLFLLRSFVNIIICFFTGFSPTDLSVPRSSPLSDPHQVVGKSTLVITSTKNHCVCSLTVFIKDDLSNSFFMSLLVSFLDFIFFLILIKYHVKTSLFLCFLLEIFMCQIQLIVRSLIVCNKFRSTFVIYVSTVSLHPQITFCSFFLWWSSNLTLLLFHVLGLCQIQLLSVL